MSSTTRRKNWSTLKVKPQPIRYNLDSVCGELIQVLPTIANQMFGHDRSCVDSTGIAIEVLKNFGFDFRPVCCNLLTGNRAWCERYDRWLSGEDIEPDEDWFEATGAWSVAISDRSKGVKVKGFHGHVVAVGHNRVVDTTLQQASRPDKGMRLTQNVFACKNSDSFCKSPTILTIRDLDAGVLVEYTSRPDERSHLKVIRQSKSYYSDVISLVTRLIKGYLEKKA